MTNPKTSPVAESVVEQVARAICSVNQGDDSDWGVYLDDARAAIAAMPRPAKDDTTTEAGAEGRAAVIARQVMSDSLGHPFKECSADSMGAQMIREGIRRYAANPATIDEMSEAHAEIKRLRGLLIDPGSPPWEDARAILVSEMRKSEMHDHAAWVADGGAALIPSHIALNLIAHAIKAKDTPHG